MTLLQRRNKTQCDSELILQEATIVDQKVPKIGR